MTISRADESQVAPTGAPNARCLPAHRICKRAPTTYNLPLSTRDTERVEMPLTHTKQRLAYCSTRDTSRPADFLLPSAFCRTEDGANFSPAPSRSISSAQSRAPNLIAKGGTANRPFTHVNCRKQNQLRNQGWNFPVHFLARNFALAWNLHPRTETYHSVQLQASSIQLPEQRNVPVRLLIHDFRFQPLTSSLQHLEQFPDPGIQPAGAIIDVRVIQRAGTASEKPSDRRAWA